MYPYENNVACLCAVTLEVLACLDAFLNVSKPYRSRRIV